MKEEIWNGYKIFTVEAADVDSTMCEHSKANDNEVSRNFHLPSRSFEVSIKFPLGEKNSNCQNLVSPNIQ
jgi:hypothetical protein